MVVKEKHQEYTGVFVCHDDNASECACYTIIFFILLLLLLPFLVET